MATVVRENLLLWYLLAYLRTCLLLTSYFLHEHGQGMIKSDVFGGPKRSTLEGAIVVRPLTFHTASDGWKAESFFDRLSARKLADFKNSATAYAEAFDPVTKFGNATVQAMLDNPAAAFESLHVWTLAYGMTAIYLPHLPTSLPCRINWETCLPHADALYTHWPHSRHRAFASISMASLGD